MCLFISSIQRALFYGSQNKNITIVHAQSFLLNDTYPSNWRRKVTKSVTARGINVVLDDYVDDLEIKDGKINTRSGKPIVADLVVSFFITVRKNNPKLEL